MAIQFARVAFVGRSSGGNACCKGAYNARSSIKDMGSNKTYNFSNRHDNVFHEVLLPRCAHEKFKDVSVLMNEIEKCELRKNSQLLKEYVIALPAEIDVSLEIKKEMIYEFIKTNRFIENNLAVQIDIHSPHGHDSDEAEKKDPNWHAHILVSTRRFAEDGLSFGEKARDLNPIVKGGKDNPYINSKEEVNIGEMWKTVQNSVFEKHGMDNRVDEIALIAQEHVGPVRMRSIINEAVIRNEERKVANEEIISSPAVLLDKISKYNSTFTLKDLQRHLKPIENKDDRYNLIQATLSHKDVVELRREDGGFSGHYTTKSAREEELKIMRLVSYIRNQDNVLVTESKAHSVAKKIYNQSKAELNDEQQKAIEHLVFSDNGIRVLSGRAGTGKSRVLKNISDVASFTGVRSIGLAPTHKARLELHKSGFEENDTVKGFLFKLYNGRASLAKGSLVVVDEAGMLGNSDYSELLRVVAGHKCNLILSGDERQLESIERGGMFEVIKDQFGASDLTTVVRQSSHWARSVSTCLSEENVRGGIAVLQKNNKIIHSISAEKSLEQILLDWSKSKHTIENKLILSVQKHHVSMLNAGAREHLKAQGVLTGYEIRVGIESYMKGDRIVITETNKNLDLKNGEFGKIISLSKNKFKFKMDDGKVVSFAPHEYNRFMHGYATTIYKAQGATIKDVYNYHAGFGTIKGSYVALSRHAEDVKLYINAENTKDTNHLISQLSFNPSRSSSLNYRTKMELKTNSTLAKEWEDKHALAKIGTMAAEFVSKKIKEVADKHLPNQGYYQFEKADVTQEKVEEVLDLRSNQIVHKHLAVAGDRASYTVDTTSHPQSAMHRHNVSMDSIANIHGNAGIQAHQGKSYTQIDYAYDTDRLRSELKYSAESIARDILGEPNNKLSNSQTLRYGEKGSLAVSIRGFKSGMWYDFNESKGGDLFDLVSEHRGGDFKESAHYLRSKIGLDMRPTLKIAYHHDSKNTFEKSVKDKELAVQEDIRKTKNTLRLYSRSKLIIPESVAYRYLRDTRHIHNTEIASDIRSANIFSKELNKYVPALVAFARNKADVITGGQYVLLDKHLATKLDIEVPKKSFGKISGSFVKIGSCTTNNHDQPGGNTPQITFLAEGLETALSIKESGVNANILCSLGISNIKNYSPIEGERIIIAADNDGEDSITSKIIEKAKIDFEHNGAFVEIVQPEGKGDFNDILLATENAAEGVSEIHDICSPAIMRHQSTSLEGFFGSDSNDISHHISADSYNDLVCVRNYGIDEQSILDAFRISSSDGEDSIYFYKNKIDNILDIVSEEHNASILDEAKHFGYDNSNIRVIQDLIDTDIDNISGSLHQIRNDEINNHIKCSTDAFGEAKESAANLHDLLEVVENEQEFWGNLLNNIATGNMNAEVETRCLEATQSIEQDTISSMKSAIEYSVENNLKTEDEIMNDVLETNDIHKSNEDMNLENSNHYIERHLIDFNFEKQECATSEEVISVIEKEQNFLLDSAKNLDFNIKDSDFKEAIETALYNAEHNVLDKLSNNIDRAHDSASYEEKDLLDDLKTTTNINETVTTLDNSYLYHTLTSDLHDIAEEKIKIDSPEEGLELLLKEQELLSSNYHNVECFTHDQVLTSQIESAHNNLTSGLIDNFEKSSNLMIDRNIVSDQAMTEKLNGTTSDSMAEMHKDFVEHYQKDIVNEINKGLDAIHEGTNVTLDHKEFDNHADFLKHIIDHHCHKDFYPTHNIDEAYQTALKNEHEIEHEIHHNNGYGGPEL